MKPLSKLIPILLCAANVGLNAQELYRPAARRDSALVPFRFPGAARPQQVKVDVVDGTAVFEGDIVLGHIDSLRPSGRGIASQAGRDLKWPEGILPYEIERGHFGREAIESAISYLNTHTNLVFREKRDNDRDFLYFTDDHPGECWSLIGKQGGRQIISIGTGCTQIGIVMHEALHAAGFIHEQSRSDRINNVQILWDNILPGKGHNFNMVEDDVAWSNYDFNSVMHYGRTAFGKPAPGGGAMQTIRSLRGAAFEQAMGQRDSLSTGDIRGINLLYNIPGSRRGGTAGTATSGGGTGGRIVLSGKPVDTLDILFDVEMIPQTTGMSCWAAAAAMVVGWRDEVTLNPSEIAGGIGYWSQYATGGLPPADTTMFVHWGLYPERPREYTVQEVATMLWEYGPLWVASAELGPHIRVVRGMHGDGTPQGTVLYINDPWQRGMTRFFTPNLGSTYVETFAEFVEYQRRLMRQEGGGGFYIAHP
jgi:Astacin (Peptidase family M12A)/Papain-like cysteine protease AvrRpt2